MKHNFNTIRGIVWVLGGMTVLTAPTVATAQFRDGRGAYPKAQVESLIKRTEQNSNMFRATYERSLGHRGLPDNEPNRFLKANIQHTDEALERLRSHYNRNQPYRDTKFRVEESLQQARLVNRTLEDRRRFSGELRRQWDRVRFELNGLAVAFDLPSL